MLTVRKSKFIKRVKRSRSRVARVSRGPRPENKHYDTFGTVTITQNGTLSLLSGVLTQGPQDVQRIGDSIYASSVFIKMTLIANPTPLYDNIRVLFLKDLQGYNAPIVNDILEPGTIASGFAPFSQYNHFLMSRFKIIYDKIFTLNTGNNKSISISKYIPVKSKIQFIGGATFKNQIYMLLIGDNGNLLQLPICNFVSRIIYNDI